MNFLFTSSGSSCLIWDCFNGDGGVTVLDIVGLVNYVVYGEYPPGFPYWFENGDVNDDGIIDVIDLVLIVSIIMTQ